MQVGLQRLQALRCVPPFQCDDAPESAVMSLCSKPTEESPERFFGRDALAAVGCACPAPLTPRAVVPTITATQANTPAHSFPLACKPATFHWTITMT